MILPYEVSASCRIRLPSPLSASRINLDRHIRGHDCIEVGLMLNDSGAYGSPKGIMCLLEADQKTPCLMLSTERQRRPSRPACMSYQVGYAATDPVPACRNFQD